MDVSRRAQSAAPCRGWAFKFAGWRDRPGGSKIWERIAVDEHGLYGNTADEKFVHPPATGELDEGNGERHGKQPDDAIRVKVTAPGGHDYAHEAKEDFYAARQLQCSPERPDEGTRASRSPDDGANRAWLLLGAHSSAVSSADIHADSPTSVSPTQLAVEFHGAVPYSPQRLSRTESIRKRPRAEQTSYQRAQRSPSASHEF